MSVDRGFTWMDEETLALIDIYSKEDVQQELNSSKRNISVYERIAVELSDVGFRRTANQCREKIKRLRKEYHLAKYCLEHDITNKKPMKYFELADKIFNRDNSEPSNCIDFGLLSSEFEDELHFSFTHDPESDTSNSCSGLEPIIPQIILPGPSCSPIHDHESSFASIINSQNSPSNAHTDSNDTFLLNGEQTYDCSGQDSPLDDSESPWVPNVVLVENDLGNSDLENCSENPEMLDGILHENGSLNNFQSDNHDELVFEDSDEPPQKRRRQELTQNWFKQMLNTVTDTFLKYHETAESRFLERVTHLEQERMKRDEKLQKLWMEFEERRRKEERQHELKMMSLLGQFICQLNQNENNNAQ